MFFWCPRESVLLTLLLTQGNTAGEGVGLSAELLWFWGSLFPGIFGDFTHKEEPIV